MDCPMGDENVSSLSHASYNPAPSFRASTAMRKACLSPCRFTENFTHLRSPGAGHQVACQNQ